MTKNVADVDTSAGILRLGNLFCDSQALHTAVQLDLFSRLHGEPATADEIRQRLGLHGRGLSDFLRLLVALGLLEIADGRYTNAPGADRHLVQGLDSYLGGFLSGVRRNIYPLYGRLTDALRTGQPQADGDFESMLDDPVALGHFVRMMDGLTEVLGAELVKAFDWSRYRTVLDLGGCRGNLVAQLLAAAPGLTGHVLDRPQLAPFFDEYLADRGLTDRATFHSGDFFRDPLPAAEVMVYGHILHDWSPHQREYLVRQAYQALEPGGALLVYDRMLPAARDNVENLTASLTMLLVTEGGGEYTVTEVGDLARAAGFTAVSHAPLGDYETLVVCHKPRTG
jgi:hypothetical protein